MSFYTKFTLEIDMGNDAMRTRRDVARALRAIAAKVNESTHFDSKVMDANGNTVGYWELEHGSEKRESQASQHADAGYMNDARFGPPEDF